MSRNLSDIFLCLLCLTTLVRLFWVDASAYQCSGNILRELTPRVLVRATQTQVRVNKEVPTSGSYKMADPPDQFSPPELCRVAVRLPPFWPDRPAIWFAQAESQFELSAITRQRTKFNYVVSQLNQQQAAEVEDIITNPPELDPYEKLKTELIRRLSTSREQCVRQLLTHEEMGDRKPSQFLRHLKSLAPDVPTEFLRTVWASRLPSHVQAILAGQTDSNIEAVAQLADRICEVMTTQVTASISPQIPDNIAALTEKVEELSRKIAILQVQNLHSRSAARERPRSRSRDGSREKSSNNVHHDRICWYHKTFGNAAHKCTPPCSYPSTSERQHTADKGQENSNSGR